MKMILQEDLLHFIWKFRRFNQFALKTNCGLSLQIISVGTYNVHAGPDFKDALLRIGGTMWAGNVEIHIRSSDWKKHNHTIDTAYDNVILHVVFEHDCEVLRTDGTPIPTLVLKPLLDDKLFTRYHQLVFAKQQFIACEKLIQHVDDFHTQNWLNRLLVERLEDRSAKVMLQLEKNKGDWDETFYQFMARNFGFQVNALPFEMLAASLPQKIFAWHKINPKQIEALIFGQAGFLEADFADQYPRELKEEYQFLKAKYGMQPIQKHLWKFFRLRPVNFPTIRLAQFAALVIRSEHLFSNMLEHKDLKALNNLFSTLKINPYWENHYQFDKSAICLSKQLGRESIENILINTVCLFFFAYEKVNGQQKYISWAMTLLENLPAENNKITKGFVDLSIKPVSAYHSQALLELKKHYCDCKRCLQCAIGCQLLKPA